MAVTRKLLRGGLVAMGLACSSATAVIWTYTELSDAGNDIALGYPVPMPQPLQQPGDYFRAYDQLFARHQALMVNSDLISGEVIGQTLKGEDIWAYVLSDGDNTTHEGTLLEAAMLQNGGIHAREWQSPEVVTGLMEHFAEHEDDGGVHQYLLENTRMVLVPVLNVDGFRQTQRYPDQVMASTFAEDPADWPRDGRMRRKNQRGNDNDLTTENDNLQGVDLNRNNNPWWASSNRSSSDSGSLVHHGSAPASEPETQALQAAAALAGESRLRFYIDNHSFSKIYFTPMTGNARRDALTQSLVDRMRSVNGNVYAYGPSNAGGGIGATDEYFANTYQIPSYTLEIEPGQQGAVEYGGFGVSHDGFILPEDQIARVRDELSKASVLGFYIQSGPPALLEVSITKTSDDSVVFEGTWSANSTTVRSISETTSGGLESGVDYRITARFNKPMRWINASGDVANYPGQSIALAPSFNLEGASGSGQSIQQSFSGSVGDWLVAAPGSRYLADSFTLEFTIPGSVDLANATRLNLAFNLTDMAGVRLDSDPGTVVDWDNGSWSDYENSDGTLGDQGGIDRSFDVKGSQPTPAPPPAPPASSSGGGGGSPQSLLLLIVLPGAGRLRGLKAWRKSKTR